MPKRPHGRDRPPRAGALAPDDLPPHGALERAAIVACFALLVLLSLRQVGSLDAGFHLEAGNSILDGHGWPRYDTSSHTMGDHRYVDTSWGYQVLAALAERAGGSAALVVLHSALVVTTFGLILLAVRSSGGGARILSPLLLAGVLAAEMRFEARPELASYAMLAGVLALCHLRAERGHAPLWLLPPLFLVWANVHSLFVLGWVALAAFVVGITLAERRVDRQLAGWSAAAVAVTVINPYGWRTMVFPFTLVTRFDAGNPFAGSIGEFESPFDLTVSAALPFSPGVPLWAFRTVFVLVAVSLVPLAFARRWAALLVALPFLLLSARMVRNMPLLVVAGLPGLFCAVAPLARRLRSTRLGPAVSGVTLALTLLVAVRVTTDAYYIASRRLDRFGLSWNGLVEPVDAAGFLRRADLPGRMLNHLNFGGYLMWALDEPVYIDGRLEVVGERFYEEYRRVLSSPQALEAEVARRGIGWLVFPYANQRSLLQQLTDDPRWRLLYFDHIAAVFGRADLVEAGAVEAATRAALAAPPPPPLLADLPGLDAPRPSSAQRWIEGLFRRQHFPHADHGRGLFHYYRRDPRRAAVHFADAVRASGGAYWELYQNLGAALRRLGATSQALACYRVVARARPGDRAAAERIRELEGGEPARQE